MPSPPPDDHLDEQRALDLVEGALDEEPRAIAHAHLAECPTCAAFVADLARALGADEPLDDDGDDDGGDGWTPGVDSWGLEEALTAVVSAGTRIGRYRVLRPLAAGGMGVVYVAEDPRLQREVALKLLRADMTEPGAATRLRREAQALARLSSPHVVTVHAAGDSPHGAWVAMDLIPGQTLADWMRGRGSPAPWRDVLARFTAAARGLRDAHDAGIVHRDFKPSNVLLGDDGRVLVADFGLAATYDAPTPPSVPTDDPELGLGRMTRTGGIVGTPAYMAPEQLAGRPADARSDQFSLCVALFEGLFGVRPYPGTTLAALTEALEHGRIRRVDGHRSVPGWLRRAVRRGLHPDPQQRHRDLHALLDALAPERQRRVRRRRLAAVAVLAPLVGLLGVGRAPAVDPCATADAPLDAVWNDQRRDAVSTAFMATGNTGAPTVLAAVVRTLDDRAQRWRDAAVDACEATQRTEAADRVDQRVQCLTTALDETDAAIESLHEADAQTIGRADRVLAGLIRISDCEDPDYLDTVIPPPTDPALADAIVQLRRDAARARTRLATTLDLDAAVQQWADLDARAQQLDYAPLRVSIAIARGRALHLHGDETEAIARLEPAYFEALQLSDHAAASEAAGLLTMAHGHGLGQVEDALRWSRHAESAARAMDDPTELAVAHIVRGELLYTHQRHEEAEQTLLAARTMLPPEAGLRIRASVAETLGNLYANAWEPERALPYFVEAIELHERRVGPDHHDLIRALNGQAVCMVQLQRFDEGTAAFRRASVIADAGGSLTAGPAAQLLTNLGALHEQRGQLQQALRTYRKGLERLEALLGAEHEETMTNLFNVANVMIKLERYEEALEAALLFEQRAALRPTVVYNLSLRVLGVEVDARRALGQWPEAIAAQRRRIEHRREQTPDEFDAIAEEEALLLELERERRLATPGAVDQASGSSSLTSAI